MPVSRPCLEQPPGFQDGLPLSQRWSGMKEDGAICLTSSLTLPQNAVSLALSQSVKLNIKIHYITKNATSCSFTNILPRISMEDVGIWSDLSLSGITWFKRYVTVCDSLREATLSFGHCLNYPSQRLKR